MHLGFHSPAASLIVSFALVEIEKRPASTEGTRSFFAKQQSRRPSRG